MPALADREDLEAEFARKLGKLAARHRRELEQLLGTPPNIANVPAEFWTKVRQETEQEAAVLMGLIFLASAEEHGLPADDDVTRIMADGYAAERAAMFAQSWTTTSMDRIATASDEWTERLRQAGTDGAAADGTTLVSRREVTERTLDVFGPRRVEGAAVTETTAGEFEGGRAAAEASPVSLVAVWRHGSHRPRRHSRAVQEPCPICSDIENLTEWEWMAVHPDLLGPPAHPLCDCFVEWIDPNTLDEIPTGRTFPGISQPVASRIR